MLAGQSSKANRLPEVNGGVEFTAEPLCQVRFQGAEKSVRPREPRSPRHKKHFHCQIDKIMKTTIESLTKPSLISNIPMSKHRHSIHVTVTVIGSGVIGITAAIELAQAGFDVKVVSHLPLEKTTSYVAAAFWLPVLSGIDPRIPEMAQESLRTFNELAKIPGSGVHPIRLRVCYTGADGADLSWLEATPTRRLDNCELPPGCEFGYEANVFRMQMENYLPFLRLRASFLGVEFVEQTIDSFDDLSSDIIVNCSGIFARQLANDEKIEPIRGQVVLVDVPETLKKSEARTWDVLIVEGPNVLDYVVFRDGDVLLGGTADFGNGSLAVQPVQTEKIIERCIKLCPQLKKAKILLERVGLRPGRHMIRTEVEKKPNHPPIIHSYGHGGAGVTLSWGNALLVRTLAQQIAFGDSIKYSIANQVWPKAA
jgi:D-amino-acid oxidase